MVHLEGLDLHIGMTGRLMMPGSFGPEYASGLAVALT
jgi:hypothetical protein